ncbi:MAG: hypothetical protein SFY32_16885 [Bacteroidota bacterium]|nr:hypothetical protein [Bacteroidota bacterium]
MLICSYFFYRIPIISKILEGEDTIFGELFIGSCSKPYYWCMGFLNNQPVDGLFLHPTIFMEILHQLNIPIQHFIPLNNLNDLEASVYIRLFCSSFFLLGIIIFSFWSFTILKFQKPAFFIFMIFLAAISQRYGVDNSVFPHIDTTVAIVAACILMVTVDNYLRKAQTFIGALGMFCSCTFFCFGKQEWTILLFLSVLATFIFHFRKLEYFKFFIIMFCAIIFGNLISYLFDPVNYNGGLALFVRMFSKYIGNGVSNNNVNFMFEGHQVIMQNDFDGSHRSWLTLFLNKLESVYFIFALMLVLSIKCILNINKISVFTFWIWMFTLAFFFAFFISSWDLNRYFILSYFSVLFYTVSCYRDDILGKIDRMIIVIICFVSWLLGTNYLFSFVQSNRPKLNFKELYFINKQSIAPKDTLQTYIITFNKHHLNPAISFYFHSTDSFKLLNNKGIAKIKKVQNINY